MTATEPITFTPAEVRTYCLSRVPNLKPTSQREWRAPCPVHHGQGLNFSVNSETGLATCHSQCGRGWDLIGLEMELSGCDFKTAKATVFGVVGRLEIQNGNGRHGSFTRGRIIATCDYLDENKKLLFQSVRYDPKDFRQRQPDGRGGWVWNIKGVHLVLYRLPNLLEEDREIAIFVCEGEKDVHALESLGLRATCNPMGAGKWRPEYSETLRGHRVVILPDNDEPGRKHAATVAADLLRVGCKVCIIELPRGKDASDWVEAGGTLDELQALLMKSQVLTVGSLAEWGARWGLAAEEPRQQAQDEATEVEADSVTADEWPKPEPMQDDLPPVQDFQEDLLPASFRAHVADVAERMQVPMDFPAVVSVVSLAGVVGRRAIMQPLENDTSWTTPANLWGAIVAEPGQKKTPVVNAGTGPLNRIEAGYRQEYEEAQRHYELAKEEHKLRHAAWQDQYKANIKNSKPAPARPEAELTQPAMRRLVVTDSTVEKLHETLAANPAGVLLIRDELTGLLSRLDQEQFGSERAFYLSAWDGNTPHGMDRIGRGVVYVPHCCLSIAGGIQPGRLRYYLADTLKDGPGNDGLIQRYQVTVWPDKPTEWHLVDRKPNAAAEEAVSRVFRRLVELDPENPVRARFNPEAQQLFNAWLTELEKRLLAGGIHPALITHLSKYRSLMPKLALLFELADLAADGSVGFVGSNPGESQNFWVSLEHTRQAAAWCEYLESHARRIYSCITTPQIRAARELADHIRQKHVTNETGGCDWFAARDVYRKEWSGLDSPDAVRRAAEVLQDAGWLRELSGESGPKGGRPANPANRWAVNPGVWR